MVGIPVSKYYGWRARESAPNEHNAPTPKSHWTHEEEREAIIAYAKKRPGVGYRRLTYMMLDENIAYVSPSTVYRVLKSENMLEQWDKTSKKGTGFVQPCVPHQHWHTDISYLKILNVFYFFISVLDGFSRAILYHEIRSSMTTYDVELVIQKAREAYPNAFPTIISDNGSQYISREFAAFVRSCSFKHVRTSPYYPQSNGKIERFHGTLKSEHVRKTPYTSIEDAREAVAGYVEEYNTKRLHSSIFYLTPEDMLMGRKEARLKERDEKLEKGRIERKKKHLLLTNARGGVKVKQA